MLTIRKGFWTCVTALFAVLAVVGTVEAARLRYRYVPGGADGVMTLAPSAFGTPGVRITLRGSCPDSHPFSGQTINVPLNLPGNPTIYYKTNAVLYDYSGDFVEVRFLPDGSVEVIYSTGLFRSI